MAQHACQGETHWRQAYKGNTVALKELEEREEYCLDLTFMHALLGLGYEIGQERELIVRLPPPRLFQRALSLCACADPLPFRTCDPRPTGRQAAARRRARMGARSRLGQCVSLPLTNSPQKTDD